MLLVSTGQLFDLVTYERLRQAYSIRANDTCFGVRKTLISPESWIFCS